MCSSFEAPDPETSEAVLLAIARPCDVEAVGDALVAALGLVPAQARVRARSAGGIVCERVSAAAAKRALAALRAAGLAARRCAASTLPALAPVRRVTHLALADDALRLRLGDGGQCTIPYPAITLALAWALRGARQRASATPPPTDLARAAMRLGEHSPLEEAALRLSDARARLRKREQARIELGLDLLTDTERLRLFPNRLDWQAPAGIAPHSAARWCALLERLCARLPAAALAPETAAMRAGLLEAAWFHQPEERERYTRWLLAMRASAEP